MKHYTYYNTAAHWGGVNLVLCNNIAEIDRGLFANVIGKPLAKKEVSQYLISDVSDDYAEWLVNTFDLTFAYSNVLDCWILLVDHYGTLWDGVSCEVFSTDWWEINGEKYGYKD